VPTLRLEPGTDLCALGDLADGAARVMHLGPERPEIIVARDGARVFGYINACAHMAVPLNLLDDDAVDTADRTMRCDHHYAAFRFHDGVCIAGPCEGDALAAIPLALRAGRIVIGDGAR
jgi:nitrite reductase/ring-hydroxylating ferredoxin subunit